MKKLLRTVLVATFVLMGGAAGLFGTGILIDIVNDDRAEADQGPPAAPTKVAVTAGAVSSRSVERTVKAIGSTEAAQSIDVRASSEGRVTQFPVGTGDRVEKGDLILKLDDRAQEAELKQATANLTEARGALERAASLSQRNITSEASLETVRATLLAAEAQVERAEKLVSDRQIVAAFAGTVGMSSVDVGQIISPTTIVTTLDDLSAVEVAFALPEQYYSSVEIGQTIEAGSVAYPDRVFEGIVSEIGTRIDPGSRSFDVKARIGNPDRALTAGLFMKVTLKLGTRNSTTVPETGIVSRGEEDFVFSIEDGVARRRSVQIGQRLGEEVEILSGVEPGAEIVVEGIQSVEDGDPVSVADEEPADADALG